MSWIFPDSGIRILGKLSGFLKSIYLDCTCYVEFPDAKYFAEKSSFGIRFCPESILFRHFSIIYFLFWITMEFYSLFRLVLKKKILYIIVEYTLICSLRYENLYNFRKHAKFAHEPEGLPNM